MCPLKSQGYDFRSNGLVPTVGSEVFGGTVTAVGNGFIKNIPAGNTPFVSSHYSHYMLLQAFHNNFFACQRAFNKARGIATSRSGIRSWLGYRVRIYGCCAFVLEKPLRCLTMPG